MAFWIFVGLSGFWAIVGTTARLMHMDHAIADQHAVNIAVFALLWAEIDRREKQKLSEEGEE